MATHCALSSQRCHAASASSGSGTFGIRLEIPNPKGLVLTGVKCSAEL